MLPNIKKIDFKLSTDLLVSLNALDWTKLPVQASFSHLDYVRYAWKYNWFIDFIKYYNLIFPQFGKIKTFKLPDELDIQVRDKFSKLFSTEIANQAIIRLQVVYGGCGIPIHIDSTRSASIVYPLKHSNKCLTSIHKSWDGHVETHRGILNPRHYVTIKSVNIQNQPVLIDVNQPHSISYPSNSYTKSNPRISLGIKFEKITYSKLLNAI
jgi:hypothetical protein